MNPSLLRPPLPQKQSPGSENTLVQELQFLITELKERDEQLNNAIAVQQRQFLAWEDDRKKILKKILTLEERCDLLNNELNKINEIIKALNKKLELLQSQQYDSERTLENTQQKFEEVSRNATDATLCCQALEEQIWSLHCSVLELSAKAGQLKAREQELLTMLKLKDEVKLETTDPIIEFTYKFRKLESTLPASKAEELSLNKDKLNLKLRLRELMLETDKLKDDLCKKVEENNKQQKEILHLRQENSCLRNEIALTVEKEKRKDQLLQSVKSQLAETDTELSRLRQFYQKQEHDLQLLRVSLESSQELRQKHEKVTHERSIGLAFSASESNGETDVVRTEGTYGICKERGTAEVPKSRVQTTSKMCEVDNRLLRNASDLEEATSVHLNRSQKVVKVLAVPTEEEEKQDAAIQESEFNSSARSFIIKDDTWWKPVSDLEWLSIFKPMRRDGKDCSCLKNAEEIKCASSKSEKSVDLNSFHLDSLCSTSTQRADTPQRCVKFSGEDFPLEINNFSVTNPADRGCSATVDQDTSSPISKLQHTLAESRQMVADPELSAVLPVSPHCSPNSSSINMTAEVGEALHGTRLVAGEERYAKLPFFSQ